MHHNIYYTYNINILLIVTSHAEVHPESSSQINHSSHQVSKFLGFSTLAVMFFGPSFNGQKCKAQLKMASIRISQQSNKKTQQIKALKREIAQLLSINKEEKARIKTEHIIREDFVMEAYETLSLLCDLLHERMPLIQSLKLCPPDLHESVVTIIYAAARTEIPELMKVRKMFRTKYGEKFEEQALMNENRVVNERIVNKLGINPPNSFLVLEYMKEIAKAHNVEWDHHEAIPEQSLSNPMPAPTGFSIKSGTGGGMQQVYGQQVVPTAGVVGQLEDRVQCGSCGAILAVPKNVPRFACSNCGALLASPKPLQSSVQQGVPVVGGQYLNNDIPNLKHVDGNVLGAPDAKTSGEKDLPSPPTNGVSKITSTQQTLTVTIPPSYKPGHRIKLKLENGQEIQVDVPPGATPGTTIQVPIPRDNGSGFSSIPDGAKDVTENMGGDNPSTQPDTKPNDDEKSQSSSSLPELNSQKSDDSVPDFDELAARFAALKK